MPWKVERTKQCPVSRPWGVIRKLTGKVVPGGCHKTRKDANTHMSALYASEPGLKKKDGSS